MPPDKTVCAEWTVDGTIRLCDAERTADKTIRLCDVEWTWPKQ